MRVARHRTGSRTRRSFAAGILFAITFAACTRRPVAPPAPCTDVASCTAACDRGQPAECLRAGEILHSGKGAAPNAARAAVLYQRACDAKLGAACNVLGLLSQDGVGVAQDLGRARSLYDRS